MYTIDASVHINAVNAAEPGALVLPLSPATGSSWNG
jgi:hypothetical protein